MANCRLLARQLCRRFSEGGGGPRVESKLSVAEKVRLAKLRRGRSSLLPGQRVLGRLPEEMRDQEAAESVGKDGRETQVDNAETSDSHSDSDDGAKANILRGPKRRLSPTSRLEGMLSSLPKEEESDKDPPDGGGTK